MVAPITGPYMIVKFEFGFAGTLRIVCRQGPPGRRGSHRPASCGCQLPAMRIGDQRRIRRRRRGARSPGQAASCCRTRAPMKGSTQSTEPDFAIARLPCTVIRKGPLGATLPLTLAEISASWSRCSFRGSFQRTVNRGSFNGPPSSEPSSSGMLITPKALFSIVVVLNRSWQRCRSVQSAASMWGVSSSPSPIFQTRSEAQLSPLARQ